MCDFSVKYYVYKAIAQDWINLKPMYYWSLDGHVPTNRHRI